MAQNAHRILAVVTGAAGMLLVLTATARLAVETFGSDRSITVAAAPARSASLIEAVEARRARKDPMLASTIVAATDGPAEADPGLTTGSFTTAKSDMEIVPAVEGRERLLANQAPSSSVLPAAAPPAPAALTEDAARTPILDIDADMLSVHGEALDEDQSARSDAAASVIHGIVSGEAAPEKSSGHGVSGVGLKGLLN
ncbi:MAG TPA: hypothetical protein VJS40_04020 [Aestuariivirgaceae bacterium]|nr:hypothetical protein [Aestuariivirgaceae bacterium]